MYLHLGQNTVITTREIVGFFDMDNTTVTGITKKLLDRAEKEKKVFYATYELPKTYIITVKNGKERVYVSQLAASTLKKRLMEGGGL